MLSPVHLSIGRRDTFTTPQLISTGRRDKFLPLRTSAQDRGTYSTPVCTTA